MLSHLIRVTVAILATSVTVLAVGVGTAAAHVNASSPDAVPGGFGEVNFRVPNESETASTVTLRLQIPPATPLASIRTKPVPGWTAVLTRSAIDPPVDVGGSPVAEAVTEITWTAEPGAGIGPGEYQTFSISGGQFPDADVMTFPLIQTYDDGSESAWIEPTLEGQGEPENPAPTLALAADRSATSAGGEESEISPGTTGQTDAATADSGTSGLTITALVLAVLGLLAGLGGLGLGLSTRKRGAEV